MESKDREQSLKLRQTLLDLLKLCEWDLILEKYLDASKKIDDITEIMHKLVSNWLKTELTY